MVMILRFINQMSEGHFTREPQSGWEIKSIINLIIRS